RQTFAPLRHASESIRNNEEGIQRFRMQRAVYAIIFILCMHCLMPSVNGCDPTKRPPRKGCAGYDCGSGGKCGVGCSCVGQNPWCNGYCTKS
ncbi:hypothetical protein V5799_015743, partial [Amblyomma americanum]